jgi:hypothetical protein
LAAADAIIHSRGLDYSGKIL